jgi:cytidine deaminase
MDIRTINITYLSHEDDSSLSSDDLELLEAARAATSLAYAPYSKFNVGAAARLTDNTLVRGSNQENASFPAGICAERVLLAALSSLGTQATISTMAISYEGEGLSNNKPLAPCGVCRQAMAEYEERIGGPFRLILSGKKGEVQIFQTASSLLPLRFSGTELPDRSPL